MDQLIITTTTTSDNRISFELGKDTAKLFGCRTSLPSKKEVKEALESKLHMFQEVHSYGGEEPTLNIFPYLNNDTLKLNFIKGYFYKEGLICSRITMCQITCENEELRDQIIDFIDIPCSVMDNEIIWKGLNAIDLCWRVHSRDNMSEFRKMYMNYEEADHLEFTFVKNDPSAFGPEKSRFTDTGFDLYAIKKHKQINNVIYYDTGISVRPPKGFYFDIVGRSSISKTGWMLANNVGIIDAGYTGNIIIALVNVFPDAEEIELPKKIVQLIPRKLHMMECREVGSLSETSRQDLGGLGSYQFN